MALSFLQRRVDGEVARPEVAGCLVEQQRDDLVRGFAELIRCRVPVAQARQIVRDKRMLNDMESHDAPTLTLKRRLSGIVARPGSAMRPSASSCLTRAMFDADQLLFGLRGGNRAAYFSSSIDLFCPSIHPYASPSRTDSS